MSLLDHWWLPVALTATLATLLRFAAAFLAEAPRRSATAAPSVPRVRRWRGGVPSRLLLWAGLALLSAAVGAGLVSLLVAPVVESGGQVDAAQADVSGEGMPIHWAFTDTAPHGEMHLPPGALLGNVLPEIATAVDRDWSKLDSGFRMRLESVVNRLRQRGHHFVLVEGYRSPERQDSLFEQAVQVTSARAWQSRHQFGLAADLAPMQAGGIAMDTRDEMVLQAYQALGEEAEAAGLVWGGRWTLRDYGHVEMPSVRLRGRG